MEETDLGQFFIVEFEHGDETYYVRTSVSNTLTPPEEVTLDTKVYLGNGETPSLRAHIIQTLPYSECYRTMDSLHIPAHTQHMLGLPPKLFGCADAVDSRATFTDNLEVNNLKLLGWEYPGMFFPIMTFEEDASWIKSRGINEVFTVSDGEMCNYRFFSFLDWFEQEELMQMKFAFEQAVMSKNSQDQKSLMEHYFNDGVFMVGYCAC